MDAGLRRHDGVAPVGESIFQPVDISRSWQSNRHLDRSLPHSYIFALENIFLLSLREGEDSRNIRAILPLPRPPPTRGGGGFSPSSTPFRDV